MLTSPTARQALAAYIASASGADSVEIEEGWRIDVSCRGGRLAGKHRLVLRADAPTHLAASRSRAEEFALLRAAFAGDVKVPEPLFCCDEAEVLGRPFFLMRWMPGIAAGAVLARDAAWDGKRDALAAELGRQLAHIHRIVPPRAPPYSPAQGGRRPLRRPPH